MKVEMCDMDALLRTAKREIEILCSHVPEGKHIKTGDIRKLSAQLFRKISDKDIRNVFAPMRLENCCDMINRYLHM